MLRGLCALVSDQSDDEENSWRDESIKPNAADPSLRRGLCSLCFFLPIRVTIMSGREEQVVDTRVNTQVDAARLLCCERRCAFVGALLGVFLVMREAGGKNKQVIALCFLVLLLVFFSDQSDDEEEGKAGGVGRTVPSGPRPWWSTREGQGEGQEVERRK